MPYGTANVDVIQSSTSGTPPQFNDGNGTQVGTLCRAWVNFNGTNGTIRASFNVSSVTRNGTGDYTLNFTNSMPDANYSWAGAQQPSTDTNGWLYEVYTGINTRVSSVLRVIVRNSSATLIDPNIVGVSVFR